MSQPFSDDFIRAVEKINIAFQNETEVTLSKNELHAYIVESELRSTEVLDTHCLENVKDIVAEVRLRIENSHPIMTIPSNPD